MALRRVISLTASLVFTASLAGGCGSAGSTPTSGPPSGTQVPSAAAPSIEVVPEQVVGLALPGAKFVFLVQVGGSPAEGEVRLSATSAGAAVSVEPAALAPGAIAEVMVVPAPVAGDEVPVEVEITAERGGAVTTERRTITVHPGTDELRAEANAHLTPFLTWLVVNRPDLGITSETAWEAMPATWVLIVSHYLYFSSEWELDLSWHVMIPPDDWSRINLRRRWTELKPSVAFEISSVAGRTPPHEIAPEATVWR